MKYWGLIFLPIFFLIIDLFTRMNIKDVTIARIRELSPNIFTVSYILIILGIVMFFKDKGRKIIITLIFIIFLTLFLVNNVYYDIFNSFFSFNDIVIAGAGTGYIKDVLLSLDFNIISCTIILIILGIVAIKFWPKNYGKSDMILATVLILFGLTFRGVAINKLGISVDPLQWDAWNYKRNVYNSYTDSKKSMKVSGFFEYVVRDFYLSNLSKNSINKTEYINYLTNYFTPNTFKVEKSDNSDYDSIFKDKNVVIVMMESIDSWLVTKDTMPTVYKLTNEGLNFVNHFSVIYGGGATFNTEFMINTGYMTPFNSKLAAYSYSENVYTNSLANLFKNAGYSVNNFHYNNSTFYNRGDMTIAFGYEKYNSAMEMGYGEVSKFDTLFMIEERIRDMFLPEHKFMTFFTTYSAHMPYNYSDYLCKNLADKYGYKKEDILENENVNCARVKARETDEFFRLLLEALKDKEIYDNTVVIGITDHYAYAYPDQDYVKKIKNSYDDNFLNKVPFFIWSSDIESKKIEKVNSNLDVLPTIASLFGLDYNPSYYLGSNILSDSYEEFIFFADYSWYDGKTYYKDGKIIFGEPVDKEIEIKNGEKINNILDINSKVLESNFFAKFG